MANLSTIFDDNDDDDGASQGEISGGESFYPNDDSTRTKRTLHSIRWRDYKAVAIL